MQAVAAARLLVELRSESISARNCICFAFYAKVDEFETEISNCLF